MGLLEDTVKKCKGDLMVTDVEQAEDVQFCGFRKKVPCKHQNPTPVYVRGQEDKPARYYCKYERK
jgi:hypothetical protein